MGDGVKASSARVRVLSQTIHQYPEVHHSDSVSRRNLGTRR